MITTIIAYLTCLQAPKTVVNVGKAKPAIVSFRGVDPLIEFPGAVGVPYFVNLTERLRVIKPSSIWTRLISDSIRSKEPIDLMRLRIRILLSNGTQILFDNNGRFILAPERMDVITKWKGDVHELRASQFAYLIYVVQRFSP